MLKHFLAYTQGVQQQTARDGGAKLNSNPQQDSGEDPPIEFQPSCCAHVSDSHICQRITFTSSVSFNGVPRLNRSRRLHGSAIHGCAGGVGQQSPLRLLLRLSGLDPDAKAPA